MFLPLRHNSTETVAMTFEHAGFRVTGIDLNAERGDSLKRGFRQCCAAINIIGKFQVTTFAFSVY